MAFGGYNLQGDGLVVFSHWRGYYLIVPWLDFFSTFDRITLLRNPRNSLLIQQTGPWFRFGFLFLSDKIYGLGKFWNYSKSCLLFSIFSFFLLVSVRFYDFWCLLGLIDLECIDLVMWAIDCCKQLGVFGMSNGKMKRTECLSAQISIFDLGGKGRKPSCAAIFSLFWSFLFNFLWVLPTFGSFVDCALFHHNDSKNIVLDVVGLET